MPKPFSAVAWADAKGPDVAIIADAGPLYALADADDEYHDRVKGFLARNRETIIVPGPVVVEVCYLILENLGPTSEIAFLRSLVNREMLLEQPAEKDLERSIQILQQYRDAQFGMVDATVMAMSERLGIQTVLTLDHRHFSIYRPPHVDTFILVPSRKRR
jgi:predicted nucleic acid-binding protein